MNNLLIKCPHCGTIYKITKTDRENEYLITDFGDKIKLNIETAESKCIKCNNSIQVLDNSIITEDWIANLLFKVKGN